MSRVRTISPFKRIDGVVSLRVDADTFESDQTLVSLLCRSYDDAALSGTPVVIRVADGDGIYYYTKAYPTAAAAANATIDDAVTGIKSINDSALSGAPKTFDIVSGNGTRYYFKGYPTIVAEVVGNAGVTISTSAYEDAVVSGTPRLANVKCGAVEYYFKVYPTRA